MEILPCSRSAYARSPDGQAIPGAVGIGAYFLRRKINRLMMDIGKYTQILFSVP
jgi:hypothetical protein